MPINNNLLNNSILYLNQAQSAINGYGSYALEIQSIDNVEILAIKPLWKRVITLVSAFFISLTGTEHYFDGMIEKNRNEFRKLQTLLAHHQKVVANGIEQLIKEKYDFYMLSGTLSTSLAAYDFKELTLITNGWNKALTQSEDSSLSSLGYAFDSQWKEEHPFQNKSLEALTDLTSNTYNTEILSKNIANCSGQALVDQIRTRNSTAWLRIKDLSTRQLLEIRFYLYDYDSPLFDVFLKKCLIEMEKRYLKEICTEDWPEADVHHMKNGEHSEWLIHRFNVLEADSYNPIEGLKYIFNKYKEILIKYDLKKICTQIISILSENSKIDPIERDKAILFFAQKMILGYENLGWGRYNSKWDRHVDQFIPYLKKETVLEMLIHAWNEMNSLLADACIMFIRLYEEETEISLVQVDIDRLNSSNSQNVLPLIEGEEILSFNEEEEIKENDTDKKKEDPPVIKRLLEFLRIAGYSKNLPFKLVVWETIKKLKLESILAKDNKIPYHRLLDHPAFSDFTLHLKGPSEEEATLGVNSHVLASRSEYFKILLKNKYFEEGRNPSGEILTDNIEATKDLIAWMCGKPIKITKDNFFSIVNQVEMFDITLPGLDDWLKQYADETITIENFPSFLSLAERHPKQKLFPVLLSWFDKQCKNAFDNVNSGSNQFDFDKCIIKDLMKMLPTPVKGVNIDEAHYEISNNILLPDVAYCNEEPTTSWVAFRNVTLTHYAIRNFFDSQIRRLPQGVLIHIIKECGMHTTRLILKKEVFDFTSMASVLFTLLPSLMYLRLSNCKFITNAAIESIVEHTPNLKSILLEGTGTVDEEAEEIINKYCPNAHVKLWIKPLINSSSDDDSSGDDNSDIDEDSSGVDDSSEASSEVASDDD